MALIRLPQKNLCYCANNNCVYWTVKLAESIRQKWERRSACFNRNLPTCSTSQTKKESNCLGFRSHNMYYSIALYCPIPTNEYFLVFTYVYNHIKVESFGANGQTQTHTEQLPSIWNAKLQCFVYNRSRWKSRLLFSIVVAIWKTYFPVSELRNSKTYRHTAFITSLISVPSRFFQHLNYKLL